MASSNSDVMVGSSVLLNGDLLGEILAFANDFDALNVLHGSQAFHSVSNRYTLKGYARLDLSLTDPSGESQCPFRVRKAILSSKSRESLISLVLPPSVEGDQSDSHPH